MKFNVQIFVVSTLFCTHLVAASKVQEACEKAMFRPLELQYRKTIENLNKIRSAKMGTSTREKFLSAFYKDTTHPISEEKSVSFALEFNKKFIPDSKLKQKFLAYATHNNKIQDSAGYRSTIIELTEQLVPENLSKLKWFLNLQAPNIQAVHLKPANGSETGSVYGAVAEIRPSENGNFVLELIVSNNDSEPLPYLIPLIAHEIQHMSIYKERILTRGNEKKNAELMLIDEAKGYDLQMEVYLHLARRNPELFCDWVYPSWAYGNLPIPLSWAMTSMETSMQSGKFIFEYTKTPIYKDKLFLLNSDGTDLRTDIRDQISKLKLKHIR